VAVAVGGVGEHGGGQPGGLVGVFLEVPPRPDGGRLRFGELDDALTFGFGGAVPLALRGLAAVLAAVLRAAAGGQPGQRPADGTVNFGGARFTDGTVDFSGAEFGKPSSRSSPLGSLTRASAEFLSFLGPDLSH
jgi:hypothetical protein